MLFGYAHTGKEIDLIPFERVAITLENSDL